MVEQMPPTRRNSNVRPPSPAKREHSETVTKSDPADNAYAQTAQPPLKRLCTNSYPHQCQREDAFTGHLDKSKPVRDETQANQAALVKFQMQHALSMHQTASQVIEPLQLDSTSDQCMLDGESLATLAKSLSDFRTNIRTAAHNTFQDQKLNRLAAKIDNKQPADTLTLKGHATQMVMTALRNTLIDQGITRIEAQLNQNEDGTDANSAVVQAFYRLATTIELLEVTRFNPLLAYHDIDHTLWVMQGSMALIEGAYDHAITKASSDHQNPEQLATLKRAKHLALHKTMLFSAAHDSFFEFKPNTIIRNAGRRENNSSEGLSARNLKKLLQNFAVRLNRKDLSEALLSTELDEDIDEAIFATVPTFTNGTVINGAHALADNLHNAAQNFLVRMATAIADLEECLLPDPTRFIAKSLLLNQEGTPVVDMSLIEHRSGVLLTLSEHGDESLKSALADKRKGADFAEALDSWRRWMASQPAFAKGRQRETVNLINRLIQQLETASATDRTINSDSDTIYLACLEGLINTLLSRYATVDANENDAGSTGNNTVTWQNNRYCINNAGAQAAEAVVAELEAQNNTNNSEEEKLIALAQVLKRNLPPQVNRLTIPRVDSFGNINTDALNLSNEAANAIASRMPSTDKIPELIE